MSLLTLAFCPRLCSFLCIFVNCFFGELFYFLAGNFRQPCRHFFENNCVQRCHGNLVIPSIFMLLYHYYAKIGLLSTNQNSEIFSAYIINRIIHGRLEMWNLSSRVHIRYLTRSLHSLVRYRCEHSKINSLSPHVHVLFSI